MQKQHPNLHYLDNNPTPNVSWQWTTPSLFSRNWLQPHQQQQKCISSQTSPCFNDTTQTYPMRQHLHFALPSAKWTPDYSDNSIQLCMMKVTPMSQVKIERLVTVNRCVLACACPRKLATKELLQEFPCQIVKVKCLHDVMQCVERAHICPGNPQPEFLKL